MPDPQRELVVYGIPNCDQVKKTVRWLDQAQQEFRFFDLRRDGLTEAHLEHWLQFQPWEVLVNQKGTTWRNLAPDERPADLSSARRAMLANPTLIKRPILEYGNAVVVGYAEDRFAALLKTS
ncbi:MAG: Spx/MgsR family RNA polymerase-binding regulatory protein [Burkholderiaceae bacterium]|jgi:Spx/MgsR family transcriptional regulator